MTQIIKPDHKTPEVADILHLHLNDYKAEYPLWPEHRKIATNLLNCRTARLGGHIERCDNCGAVRITYHSCRNRHCPKCQHMPRERWLEKRKDEILPISYFHVVFTLPHELNTVILNNKKVMFNILFKAASRTLLTFGDNELNGKLGFLAVLHTWDQKLNAHFHLHCLVPAVLCQRDKKQWLPVKNDYLFNEEALSRVFRGKFMERLKHARKTGVVQICRADPLASSKTCCMPKTGWSVCVIRSNARNMCSNTWHAIPIGWPLPTAALKNLKMAWSPLPLRIERRREPKQSPSQRWSLSGDSFYTASQ